jgi:tetratricopeptide (TPR) repeat protein
MLKKIFFLSALFLQTTSLIACLNEHHVDKQGREMYDTLLRYYNLTHSRFYKNHNRVEIEQKIAMLLAEKPVKELEILSNRNNLAVNYIKLGKLDEAENLLNGLLEKFPEEYSVIINLGTLYELRGENKKALKYIKKAMAINPASHAASEWFHVRILEFKLRGLPVSEIRKEDILKLHLLKADRELIAGHINYQLEERIPFTPAPDPLMAKVLQEFGDFLADSLSISGAYVIYEIGMDYDKANLYKMKEKREALIPYFTKYGEVIPRSDVYYVEAVSPIIEKNTQEESQNGPGDVQKRQKVRERKRVQNAYIIIGSLLFVCIPVYMLYKRTKK